MTPPDPKHALVTGASEGIGREFARQLAARGHRITAVARSEDKLRSLVAELGAGHDLLVADLADPSARQRVVEAIHRQHHDLLVNDAGVGAVGAFADVPLDQTLHMLRLNCEALVVLAHAFLRQARPGDALINVSSTLAFLPMATVGAYSGTKAFVTAFSEALWFEQKPRGVYVMGLCPGSTSTEFQVHAGGRATDRPRGLTETPEQVVSCALRALDRRRRPTVVSGAKNAWLTWLARVLPRRAAVDLLSRIRTSR